MKKVTLNVPNYSPDTGVALNWEGNFTKVSHPQTVGLK